MAFARGLLCVQHPDEVCVRFVDGQLRFMLCQVAKVSRGQHRVRVNIDRRLFLRCMSQPVALGGDALRELRISAGQYARFQTGAECGWHLRAVFVDDGLAGDDVRGSPASERGQVRLEQKERHTGGVVVRDDPAQDAERRIIHHNAAVRIVELSVIHARPERADDPVLGHAVALPDIVYDDREDRLGRVTVVVRLFRLEFVDKRLIVRIDVREAHLVGQFHASALLRFYKRLHSVGDQ